MRLNVYIAQASGCSRRAADRAILDGRVSVNHQPSELGTVVDDNDQVTLDGKIVHLPKKATLLMLHKPVGYVCSRFGQGSETIYRLLPANYLFLKPVGRLDKASSGLVLLTDDGKLAHQLTHPSYQKEKVYQVILDKPLDTTSRQQISEQQVMLDDGLSGFDLQALDTSRRIWQIKMSEGRNRQIRRTFASVNYRVLSLHRSSFGSYRLNRLKAGQWQIVDQ